MSLRYYRQGSGGTLRRITSCTWTTTPEATNARHISSVTFHLYLISLLEKARYGDGKNRIVDSFIDANELHSKTNSH